MSFSNQREQLLTPQEYRTMAKNCLRQVNLTTDIATKRVLQEIALDCESMAKDLDRRASKASLTGGSDLLGRT